jgi:hypothetical protein
MKYFGRTTVSEFLDDRVVYRNLAPVDQRLPTLRELRAEIGLEEGYIPRKSEADYARVIVALLRHAQALQAPGVEIAHLIFIGDTRLNDGTAFANICQAGGWPGLAFIGSETAEPASVKIEQAPGGRPIYLANRWAALVDSGGNSFVDFCARQGFAIDAATAVVIDLDKTTLGARGRNAQVSTRPVSRRFAIQLPACWARHLMQELSRQFTIASIRSPIIRSQPTTRTIWHISVWSWAADYLIRRVSLMMFRTGA